MVNHPLTSPKRTLEAHHPIGRKISVGYITPVRKSRAQRNGLVAFLIFVPAAASASSPDPEGSTKCEARTTPKCTQTKETYTDALALASECGPEIAAQKLFALSWCFSRSAEYLRALETLDLGWRIAESTDSQETKKLGYRRMFSILHDLGDTRSARQVLDLFKSLNLDNDPVGQAWLATHQANLAGEAKRWQLAAVLYKRALNALEAVENNPWWYPITLNLVWAYVELEQPQKARAALNVVNIFNKGKQDLASEPAWTFARAQVALLTKKPKEAEALLKSAMDKGPNHEWARTIEYLRGSAFESRGLLKKASDAFRRSIAHIDALRASLTVDDFKAGSLARRREAFERLFELELKIKNPEAALSVVETLKGRVFLDAFTRSSKVYSAATEAKAFSPLLAQARTHELLRLIPALSRSPSTTPTDTPQLLEELKDVHALTYFQARSTMWLLTLIKGNLKAHKLSLSSDELSKKIDQLVANPSHTRLASHLGKILFPPGSLPKSGQLLYIVPDGSLNHAPFSALISNGKRLVKEHAIALIPSLSALAHAQRRTVGSYTSPTVLAFGPDLKHAHEEAQRVAKSLRVEPLKGTQVNMAALKSAAQAEVIHFVGHSGMGPQRPWLELADGRLRPSTIIAYHLRPRLAVFTSCGSARSWGDELWGSLAGSILASGAQGVVASLWSVDDASTRRFSEYFYKEVLKSGPAQALARAQNRMAQQGEPTSTWSAFIYLGLASPSPLAFAGK